MVNLRYELLVHRFSRAQHQQNSRLERRHLNFPLPEICHLIMKHMQDVAFIYNEKHTSLTRASCASRISKTN